MYGQTFFSTRIQWKENILKQRQSGLSIASWCRRNDIKDHVFYYWQNKLFPKETLEGSSFTEIPLERKKGQKKESGFTLHIMLTFLFFNSLYLKTDGDVVENNINTKNDIDLLIEKTGIKADDQVLDLCCGQGRHSLELARRGYNFVTGVDRSRYLIRLARKRAKNVGLAITFSEGDARKFRLHESSRDCVFLMGNSFGYFEREED
ncbi:MAG: IS66 family insertion sequence element accessory protein TnpA, partial [Chlamydiales bacterium]